MNRKWQGVGLCVAAIVGVMACVFLNRGEDRLRPKTEMDERPPHLEQPVVSVEPVATPSPTLSVAPVEETKNTAFRIRVVWSDTNQSVEGATVTLIPEPKAKALGSDASPEETSQPEGTDRPGESEKRSGTDKSAIPLIGQTDKEGKLSLDCPSDLVTTETLRCREIQAEHPAGVSVSYRGVTLSSVKTFDLPIQKAYGYFGTVYRRDAAGKFVPAPGAKVSAFSPDPAGWLEFEYGNTLKYPPFLTESDSRGRYEIPSQPLDMVLLWAHLDNLVTTGVKAPVMGKAGEFCGPFDLYLEPGASLTALVSDRETLKPIPGATVEVKFSGKLSCSATADGEGFCEVKGLPLGRIEVQARAEGYGSECSQMEMTPEGNNNTVPFFLDRGGRVRIRTVDPTEKEPVGNVPLELYGNGMRVESRSDSDGLAVVEGLKAEIQWTVRPTGPYSPVMKKTERAISYIMPTFVPNLNETVEVVVPVENARPRSSRHDEYYRTLTPIEGTLVNEAGEPLVGALLTATSKCCLSSGATDASGHFRIENACVEVFPSSPDTPLPDLAEMKRIGDSRSEPIDLAHPEYYVPREGWMTGNGDSAPYYAGPATLQIKAEGYVPLKDYRVPVEPAARIVLKEKADGVLKVCVLSAETKKPVLDYWIQRHRFPEVVETGRQRVCSRDGEIVLRNLIPGATYRIFVTADGYVWKDTDKKVETNEEENRVEILLDSVKGVDGLVVDAKTREPLSGVEIRYVSRMDRIDEQLDFSTGTGAIISTDKQVTDSRGEFHVTLNSPIGGLIFIPKKDSQLLIPLDEIEQYRDAESGKIVVPLNNGGGSLEARYFLGKQILSRSGAILHLNSLDKKISVQSLPSFQEGLHKWANLPAGLYELSFGRERLLSRRIIFTFQLAEGENRIILLGENETSTLMGRVLRSNGEQVPSATLEIESASERNGERKTFWDTKTSNAYGFYAFDYLADGEYRIRQAGSPESKTIQVEGKTTYNFVVP